eukprot:jgi/Bigna1/136401/aug1.33_g11109
MSAPPSTGATKLEIKGEECSKPGASNGQSGASKKDIIRMAQCCCGNIKLTCLGNPISLALLSKYKGFQSVIVTNAKDALEAHSEPKHDIVAAK